MNAIRNAQSPVNIKSVKDSNYGRHRNNNNILEVHLAPEQRFLNRLVQLFAVWATTANSLSYTFAEVELNINIDIRYSIHLKYARRAARTFLLLCYVSVFFQTFLAFSSSSNGNKCKVLHA